MKSEFIVYSKAAFEAVKLELDALIMSGALTGYSYSVIGANVEVRSFV